MPLYFTHTHTVTVESWWGGRDRDDDHTMGDWRQRIERPRLQLQPRTKPLEDTSGGRERREGVKASGSIFGEAKPVDTAARDREIEERVSKFS